MRESFRIISKAVFIACFGILFSLLNAKEAACYSDGSISGADLRLTIDFDSVAFGQPISTNLPITLSFPENNNNGNNRIVCSISSWIKDGALASGNFTAGTYDYYIQIHAYGNSAANPDTVPNVYVNGSQLTNVTLDRSSSEFARYYASGSVTIAAPTYTVTFEPNGGNFNGSTTAATRTTGTDGKLTAFPEVQYDGHTLVGWFDNATSTTTRVELDKVYTGATTLTAHWTENPVFVSSQLYAPARVDKGQSYTLLTTLTFDRNLTSDEEKSYVSNKTLVSGSPNYVSEQHTQGYSGKTYSRAFTLTVPSDTTASELVLQLKFDDVVVETTQAIPINNPSSTTYTVTASNDGHGRAVASPTSGSTGTSVMITATPDSDYRFKEWRVIRGGVNLSNRNSARTNFYIGNANVEVKAIFEKKSSKKDDDDHHEESSSPEKPSWTPAKAAATIAAQKAQKQQTAALQLASIQTMLRTKTSDRAGTGRNVIDLDMTKVDILDPATVNLLLLNNRFAFNVKISVPGGLTTTIMIPANFNFRPFIKADGTMNIHEVLWWIISKKK